MAFVKDRPIPLLVAYTLIALAALLIIINEFFTMSAVWIQKVWIDSSLPGWYVSQAGYLGLYPPTLFDSFFVKQVIFTWTPLLFIALLSIWTRNRPFRSGHADIGAYDPVELLSAQPTRWQKTKHQWSLFWTYQLPPRKFWGYLLDGGFNVVDFLVVALWISLNVMWLYFSFYLDWPYEGAGMGTTPTNGSVFADYCDAIGYASAWASVFNLVFVFIPLARSSFLQYLFNSDFSSIIRYHRWLGHGTLLIVLFHGLIFYIGWWSVSTAKFREETFAWQSYSINYLAGSIAFFPFGLVLWICTIPVIRRKFFKIFYAAHLIGAFGFLLFSEFHYPGCIWYMPGLCLYFMDVAFRLAQWRVTSGMKCSFVSADKTFTTINLKFNKAVNARTNQFVFINCPSVAYWQWHPYSIAAVYPSADGLTQDVIIHVKAYGSWSKKLVTELAEHGTIPVRVDGPYGAAGEPEWTHYKKVVMVAGGIGVTPLLGMLRDIQSCFRNVLSSSNKLESGEGQVGTGTFVDLFWVVRNRDELQLLDQELLMTAGKPGSWLRLNLFHTGSDAYVESAGAQQNDGLKSNIADSPHHGSAGASTRCLQPYCPGDFTFALAHLLAFAGGFFACLAVNAWEFEGSVTGVADGNGIYIIAWGTLMFMALIIGSMGFPALVIFPMQMIRYRRHVKACEQARNHAGPDSQMDQGHAKMSQQQVKNLIPDDRMTSGALDLETGKSASVSFGRPNLKKVIVDSIASVGSAATVGVIVSGPEALVRDARAATHKASQNARKAGLSGIPELAFSNHSFVL